MTVRLILIATAFAAAILSACGRGEHTEHRPSGPSGDLIVFHAGSLAVPLGEVSGLFQRQNPGVTVKAESAGSRDSARKISDLHRACDVFASADYRVVENLLIPKHAGYNICFATNEMAIAFTSKSKFADQITADNWSEILLRPGVVLGRADPDRDPCGYRTVIVIKLAEKHYQAPGLADKLLDQGRRYIRPKETDLLALLESGEIDYIFIYRSVAEQHRIRRLLLPGEVNLGSTAMNDFYRMASVKISGREPGEFIRQQGEAITYSLTIPYGSPNREAAEKYLQLLLSPQGREIFRANGQTPISPAQVDGYNKLPTMLRPFAAQQ